MNIDKQVSEIKSKDDFINFVEHLADNLKKHPEQWENKNLYDFLEAIASWTDDMEGYYSNNNLPTPQNIDWKVFAYILIAARIYE